MLNAHAPVPKFRAAPVMAILTMMMILIASYLLQSIGAKVVQTIIVRIGLCLHSV